ncbi:MAG: glycosyltransferase family 39 protein [Candidatus Zixiibacteriota bacterium]
MTPWSRLRSIVGAILVLVAASGVFAFDFWQEALAGLSPDGVIMEYSWLVLRIMMIALAAPGLVLLFPRLSKRLLIRLHHNLRRLPTTAFLTYTLGIAFVLRLLAVLVLPLRLISDFATYDELARQWLIHGEYTDGTHATAYFPPGWPFLLSRLYAVFGHHPHAGIMANVVFGVACVYLTWRIVRRGWGEFPARWAAAIVAIIPGELLFANILGSERLFTFLLLMALLLLLPRAEGGWRPWASALVGGVLLGVATLTRTLSFLLPLVFLPAYAARGGLSLRTASRWLVCVAGLLIVTVPWMMRNESRLGRATLCTNVGVNLHIGNNPNAGVGYNEPDHRVLFLKSAQDEAHDDSVGMARGLEYIRRHPVAFLVRGTLKSAFFMLCDTDGIFFELGDAATAHEFNRYCWLALATQAFWMIFLLACGYGVIVYLRSSPWQNPTGLLLLGVVLYWIAVHFVFYGAGRYHMPIVPVMAAFAGLAVMKSTNDSRNRSVV